LILDTDSPFQYYTVCRTQ